MGLYRYVRDIWKKPKENLGDLWKARLMQWRKEPATVRVDKPTRIDRARSLGYKAKQGVFVVRQRVARGGRKRERIKHGRRSKHARHTKIVSKSYQWVAEERASRKYPNCEALNSYYVGEDGKSFWYEVIMIDRASPSVLADKNLNWASYHKDRAGRGLTSAAKKSRGLRNKGKGAEKVRPSQRANKRLAK